MKNDFNLIAVIRLKQIINKVMRVHKNDIIFYRITKSKERKTRKMCYNHYILYETKSGHLEQTSQTNL